VSGAIILDDTYERVIYWYFTAPVYCILGVPWLRFEN
jgi:hypothetical protein